MKCNSCKKNIPEDAKFCPFCGKETEMICNNCGAKLIKDDRYCNQCGKEIKLSKKPEEERQCTSCGAELGKDEIFCRKCGIKIKVEISTDEKSSKKETTSKAAQKTPKKLIITLSIVIPLVSIGIVFGVNAVRDGDVVEEEEVTEEVVEEVAESVVETVEVVEEEEVVVEKTEETISEVVEEWEIMEIAEWKLLHPEGGTTFIPAGGTEVVFTEGEYLISVLYNPLSSTAREEERAESCEWSIESKASGGTIQDISSEVFSWIAPDDSGDVEITVTVTTECNGEIIGKKSDTITLTVLPTVQ